jgi:CDP-diacylglycerol--glycerol-3-phosphate 3-phosphatidyltransferase
MVRVVLIPVFLAILYIGFEGANYAAMGVFIAASLTDFADGYIARRRNQVTDFGKFMDPLADKILVFAAMLWFVEKGVLPAWLVLIVLIRELMVTALRAVALTNGRVIAAAVSGKIKTASTLVILIAMFLPMPDGFIYAGMGVIAVTTVVSGIEYFVRNRDILSFKRW